MSVRDEVRAKLIALYEKHRPEQAKHVDILLNTHKGREQALLAKVEQKFSKDPDPPAKRPCVDPRVPKHLYVVGDRVMVPMKDAAAERRRGPTVGIWEEEPETPWVPAEVVEAAEPGGRPVHGGRYVVLTDDNVQPPHNRKRLIVPNDSKDNIRPEVCFCMSGLLGSRGGRKMVEYATVLPCPDDPHQGPRAGQKWRFSLNDRVACRTDKAGDGTGELEWVTGTVMMIGGRDPMSRAGTIAAYKVNLDTPDPYDDVPGIKRGDPRDGGQGGQAWDVWSRAVWVSKDEHWLVRHHLEQPTGSINTPSIADLRYSVRAVPEYRADPAAPDAWERYDHLTGHSEPAAKPEGAQGPQQGPSVKLKRAQGVNLAPRGMAPTFTTMEAPAAAAAAGTEVSEPELRALDRWNNPEKLKDTQPPEGEAAELAAAAAKLSSSRKS